MWHPSSQNLSDFLMLLQIRWTVDRDIPTFRAISRTVNLESPSMISFIFETISLRKFSPTWFWCIFDGLYTRFNLFFLAPNRAIRHTRRSLSSRKFSHQLLQRTTKFWASFDVSPYIIFLVNASNNHFYYSGQWLRVLIWQNLCLSFSLTCTFIHRCIDLE